MIHKIPTEYEVGSWDISEEGEYVIFRSRVDAASVYVVKDNENAPVKLICYMAQSNPKF